MPATVDSVVDGASMVLGSRKKINLPTCLPFARLEYGPKSSAFWWIYFSSATLIAGNAYR